MKTNKILIPREKLTDYLLSTTHMVGRAKAKFFRQLGFDDDSIDRFEEELANIAKFGKILETIESSYGTKYIIDGTLDTPSGGKARLCTVWIEDQKKQFLRFVTAYPKK